MRAAPCITKERHKEAATTTKKKCTIFQRSVLQKCEKEKKKKAKHNQTYLIEAT